MAIATVTSKSQITIPKEVRERFRITSGMQLIFRENARGGLEITPRNVTMEETFRWADEHLTSPSSRSFTLAEHDEQMAGAMAAHVLGDDAEAE